MNNHAELSPTQKKAFGIVLAIVLLLAIGRIMGMSYQDDVKAAENSCEMTRMWNAGERAGIPAYRRPGHLALNDWEKRNCK